MTPSYLKNKQSQRSLRACLCPAFHLDNKRPSVLKEGQATPCYVRQGNVVHLLICVNSLCTMHDPLTKLTCVFTKKEKNT